MSAASILRTEPKRESGAGSQLEMEEKNMCSRSSIYKTVAVTMGELKGSAQANGIEKFDTLPVNVVMDLIATALIRNLTANDEKVNADSFKARMDAAATAEFFKALQIEAVNA
jgi:hypothetical protein